MSNARARALVASIALTIAGTCSAGTTPPVAYDFGLIPVATTGSASTVVGLTLNTPTSVVWLKMRIQRIDRAEGAYLDIHTDADSPLTPLVADTEIGLFAASGVLIATNDDTPTTGRRSQLSFGSTTSRPAVGTGSPFTGQDGASLPAGEYYVAVTSYNQHFANGFGVTSVTPGAAGQVALTVNCARLAIATPPPAIDLGIVRGPNPIVSTPDLPCYGPTMYWAKFNLPAPTDASTILCDIHTLGSSLTNRVPGSSPPDVNDTDMALYTASGNLFAVGDSIGSGSTPLIYNTRLSYGAQATPRTYGFPVSPFTGSNGAVLPAGDYYVAFGPALLTAEATGFRVGQNNSPAPATGTVRLTIATSTSTASPIVTEFGEVSKFMGTRESGLFPVASRQVRWLKFSTASATNASAYFLDIHTNFSSLTSSAVITRTNDTEIALFDGAGVLVASNDDWFSQDNTGGVVPNSYLSGLSFGRTSPARNYVPMRNFIGNTATVLPAGTYYIAASGYDASYSPAFGVSFPNTTSFAGDMHVTIVTNLPATPCGPADVAGLGGSPGADAILTVDDIVYYLSAFFFGDATVADIARLGGQPGADGQITADDIVFFLSRFFGVACG